MVGLSADNPLPLLTGFATHGPRTWKVLEGSSHKIYPLAFSHGVIFNSRRSLKSDRLRLLVERLSTLVRAQVSVKSSGTLTGQRLPWEALASAARPEANLVTQSGQERHRTAARRSAEELAAEAASSKMPPSAPAGWIGRRNEDATADQGHDHAVTWPVPARVDDFLGERGDAVNWRQVRAEHYFRISPRD